MTSEPSVAVFSSLDDYIALPRVESLALSPDGTRVVLTVATLNRERTAYERAVWQVDPSGAGLPVRLTRSAKGESAVGFTAAGDLLFVSARPDSAAEKDTEVAQLWMLPAAGGEARALTRLVGGVSGIAATARDTDTLVMLADLLQNSTSLEADASARALRKEKKVAAILHESYPVRYWDHDLGPDQTHYLALDLEGLSDSTAHPAHPAEPMSAGPASTGENATEEQATIPYPADLPRPRDLTPSPGRSLDSASQALTPDGRTLIASLQRAEKAVGRFELYSIDVASGRATVIASEPQVHFEAPAVSPDGERIAYLRTPYDTPQEPGDLELWVANLDGTEPSRVATDWDRWPTSFSFANDGQSLIVTADENGRGPIFRVPLDGSAPVRLTDDDYAYSHVAVDRVTGAIFALRSSWREPSHPVRVDADGRVTPLSTPAPLPTAPGSMTEVTTVAEDGATVRGWLMLPDGATAEHPAPFLLWVHGGPLNSWNAWSWRWSPLLAVAQGYAVLLPDPALSTGYGIDFIRRGWNSWGGKPLTDLMAITDAAVARDDIDETRTAAMGGSFGGYMANWIAGHTDRFRAIVSHASLWALDQFMGTTDHSGHWRNTFTAQGMIDNSPHHSIDSIVTPMLVIHGDHDYRVPIGESLRLWSELAEHHEDETASMPHRFLLFPDENHWVLKPQHAVVWYQTVFAFLAQHVDGDEWKRPDLLG